MTLSSDPTPAPTVNETRARQGSRGRHVLLILLASTALALAAMGGVWALRTFVEPAAGSSQEQTSGETFNAPAPPPPTPPSQ